MPKRDRPSPCSHDTSLQKVYPYKTESGTVLFVQIECSACGKTIIVSKKFRE